MLQRFAVVNYTQKKRQICLFIDRFERKDAEKSTSCAMKGFDVVRRLDPSLEYYGV